MSILMTLITAVGLSMDAFSLAIIYGTMNMSKTTNNLMSTMVGIFHFFMPLLGYALGKIVLNIIPVHPDIVVGVIFIALAIEMLFSINKDEPAKLLNNFFSVLIFAFTVSIDSFSVGIAFGALETNIYTSCIIFAMTSFIFTYIGVNLGQKLVNKFGNISTMIGSIILLILGMNYIL
ncbi:MAG: manganese efflux pump [bacterium]|nr:manganese efflux pump [bacterium]